MRACILIATLAFALGGFNCPAPGRFEQADDVVLVVAAFYPGASARVVADTVAAPIEQQIDGVEGMVRIESKSSNDGKYIAHLYFKPRADAQSAAKLVRNRVALAEPMLPGAVRGKKVSVRVGKPEADPNKAAIAVIDRQGHGWEALQKAAGAVVKRLATEDAITKPQAFPRDEKQVSIDIDRAKCASLGVSLADVFKAVQAAGSAVKPDGLKKVIVQGMVSLGEIAAIKEVSGPAAVYRIDLHPAIRITGTLPQGKSVAAAAEKCADLAEAEIKRLDSGDFAVKNLSAK